MPEYITTYTGRHFCPAAPRPEDICIEDIAHALSLITRGNGHVKSFFSVGQHCINCAREAEKRALSPRLVLACLLHDASECYMSDVPRPFKRSIPEYVRLENELLRVIYEKFLGSTLSISEEAQLKAIDDDMLYFDLLYLLNEKQDRPAPELHIELDYAFRPFAETEKEYIEIFERLFTASK